MKALRAIKSAVDPEWVAIILIALIYVFLIGIATAGAQTVPTTQPAAHPGVAWPTTLPTVPEIPRPAPDVTITIAPNGNNATGDGSLANPVLTLDRAITLAQQRGAKLPLIQFAAGGVYSMPAGFNFPNGGNAFANGLLIDGVGGGCYPTIALGDSWNFLRLNNVQIRHLIFSCTSIGKRGIYCNPATNLLIDRCKFYGFSFGVTLDGNGNSGAQIYRTGFLYQDSGNTNDSSGLYIQGIPAGGTIELGGLTFLHCGWPVNFDPTNPANAAVLNALARRHGTYGNETPYPPNTGNFHMFAIIAVDCASRGIGSRHGGVYEDLVFRGNGTAADGNFGNASYPNGTVTLRRVVCFAPAVDGAPFWGGGIELAPYVTYDAHDIYGFSASTSQLNPLLASFWDATPLNPPPGSNAGNGPMPIGTSGGTVDGIHGVWPRPAIASVGGRPLPTVTNNDVRLPKPGEQVPTLAAYYGVPESQLYALIESRVEQADAPAILAWSAQAWAAMNPAPTVGTPATVPAPFDVTLHVDPSSAKVTVK